MSAMVGLGRGHKLASGVQGPKGMTAHVQEQLGHVPEEDARRTSEHVRTGVWQSKAPRASTLNPKVLLKDIAPLLCTLCTKT